jgi:hypothetical protein
MDPHFQVHYLSHFMSMLSLLDLRERVELERPVAGCPCTEALVIKAGSGSLPLSGRAHRNAAEFTCSVGGSHRFVAAQMRPN